MVDGNPKAIQDESCFVERRLINVAAWLGYDCLKIEKWIRLVVWHALAAVPHDLKTVGQVI